MCVCFFLVIINKAWDVFLYVYSAKTKPWQSSSESARGSGEDSSSQHFTYSSFPVWLCPCWPSQPARRQLHSGKSTCSAISTHIHTLTHVCTAVFVRTFTDIMHYPNLYTNQNWTLTWTLKVSLNPQTTIWSYVKKVGTVKMSLLPV